MRTVNLYLQQACRPVETVVSDSCQILDIMSAPLRDVWPWVCHYQLATISSISSQCYELWKVHADPRHRLLNSLNKNLDHKISGLCGGVLLLPCPRLLGSYSHDMQKQSSVVAHKPFSRFSLGGRSMKGGRRRTSGREARNMHATTTLIFASNVGCSYN